MKLFKIESEGGTTKLVIPAERVCLLPASVEIEITKEELEGLIDAMGAHTKHPYFQTSERLVHHATSWPVSSLYAMRPVVEAPALEVCANCHTSLPEDEACGDPVKVCVSSWDLNISIREYLCPDCYGQTLSEVPSTVVEAHDEVV